MDKTQHAQVAIIGAGPAGLVLSHLLARQGIESVLLDARARDTIETTVRAGVLEDHVAQLLRATGVGERMDREGAVHRGIELRFAGRRHRIDFDDLVGHTITVYGQNEVVRDLNTARLTDGAQILWETEVVEIDDVETDAPRVRYRTGPIVDALRLKRSGPLQELTCEIVAGCDGFWGPSRQTIPRQLRHEFERQYPFAWFGILVEGPPYSEELIYALHERGFALLSTRSPTIQRLYLQCDPDDTVDQWPDDRIWEELRIRTATQDGGAISEGRIIDKAVLGMRSFVCEPMHYGRLYLAGDAAHIVPPTGAKGMNLAVADVRVLAGGLVEYFRSGSTELLDRYTELCLPRVWKAQRFSWWMTSMLHSFGEDPFQLALQRAELDYISGSRAGSTSLAENYVGLPLANVAEVTNG